MAFPRYFFALCAVLVFVVVVGIHAEVDSEPIELNSAELKVVNNHLAGEDGNSAEERTLVRIFFKFLFLVQEKLKSVF